ncbi:MAG TPA: glycosyltransferase family 1 protein, partial [Anaerolineales bacterium]|nr:glycosyltransferase family 1 protein [Anaerolineales bacterium]
GREILSLIRNRCRVEMNGRTWKGGLGHAWEQFSLPRKLNPESILWSPANTGPVLVRNHVLTIHDLSPLEHPEWFKPGFAIWYRLFLPVLARRALRIFAPSGYTSRKIQARFGIKNVLVTPNSIYRPQFHPLAKQRRHDLSKSYILFVGSLEPRKNLNALLQAWSEIQNEFKETWLVIAGSNGQVFRPVKLQRTVERVQYLGYVEEKDLPGLYAGATLFVLPSYDEGFGLPALEAMACGAPVLVSNGGALPETVGAAGLIFDLSRPDDLSTAIRQCLCDEDLRVSLKENGLIHTQALSWHNTAELVWKTLNEI